MMGRLCSWLEPSYQRHITFACTGCYQLHHHHRLGIITPNYCQYKFTEKGWIAWLAKADCMHLTYAQGYYTIESKGTRRNEPRLSGPRPTQYQWTNRAVHDRPRIKSQKIARSAVGVEPKPSEQLRPMTIKTSASTETATTANSTAWLSICPYDCQHASISTCMSKWEQAGSQTLNLKAAWYADMHTGWCTVEQAGGGLAGRQPYG